MAQTFKVLDLQVGPRGNEAMNRYWLDNPGGFSLPLLDVATAFAQDHLNIVRIVQSSEWEHVALFIEEVLTGVSLLVNLTGFVGERAGDTLPASNAFSFPLKPIGPVIKRGGKRVPGVREADTEDELVENAGMLGLLDGVALSMYLPIDVGGNPVDMAVVRPIGSPPTSYLVSVLNGAIYRQVGTQVSRKLSRGGGTSLSGLVPHSSANLASNSNFAGYTTDAEYQADIDFWVAQRQALNGSVSEKTRTVL